MTWAITSMGFALAGDVSRATGVSSDGSVICGYCNVSPGEITTGHAFRWTAGGGYQLLGELPGGTFSVATGISADGTKIVGYGDATAGAQRAWIWTSGGGMVDLGDIGTGDVALAFGISPDGNTVVGQAVATPGFLPYNVFTWTSGGGMVDRGQISGNGQSTGTAINDAGFVAVAGSDPNDEAARWSAGGGYTTFGFIPGSDTMYASAISADSTTVVGNSIGALTQAWKWVSGVLTPLAFLPSGTDSQATGVTANGSMVVGFSNGVSNYKGVYWSGSAAPVALPQLNPANRDYPQAVTPDGTTIVGYSTSGSELPVAVFWTNDDPPPPVVLPSPIQALCGYRGQVGINFYGRTLFGDQYSGVVGEASFGTFTEYGFPMAAEVASPPIHEDRARVFLDRFELDVQAGVGAVSGQGSDPVWMLSWSKDGGETWSTLQKWRSMGRRGQYAKRLRWLRMGQARQWVLRLTSTDPVRRTIIGTYVTLRKGMG